VRSYATSFLAVIFLIAGNTNDIFATSPTSDIANQSQQNKAPGIFSGTLNLVLANRKGFVIVTDSRRSSPNRFDCNGELSSHCDDSQKLFRTTANSAMAIAGFASGGAGTPFDLEVAAILRRKFGPNGIRGDTVFGESGLSGQEPIPLIGDWCLLVLEPALTGLFSLLPYEDVRWAASSLDQFEFIVTIAGISKDGFPHIDKILFLPRVDDLPWLGTLLPHFLTLRSDVKANHFLWESAGLDDVARKILDGSTKGEEIDSEDQAIKNYLQKKGDGRLDKMTLKEMKSLAISILRATERKYGPWVGGEDEIGVFTTKKCSEWDLPKLPRSAKLPPLFALTAGLSFDSGSTRWAPGFSLAGFQDPFMANDAGELVPQFFLANLFQNVTIRADGNYFVGNHFESVTFLYDGGSGGMAKNQYDSCTVQTPANVQIGGNFQELRNCRLAVATATERDGAQVIGRKSYLRYTPCPPRLGGCAVLSPQ